MSLTSQLAIATTECLVNNDQCTVCQRQGLPILPLRKAVVPRLAHEYPLPDDNTRMGWRTLRAGYLYVLLDRQVWQAYQVTPDGYLRQFNPYQPAATNETPLADSCIAAGHDCPAAFLNIDTQKYTMAWLAFASDPWPASVLAAYKSGRFPERFLALDLGTARNDPASVGWAMTAENLQVDNKVYEYRQQPSPSFDSVHGFYSRAGRLTALRGYLRNAIAHHDLPHGVLALELDDSIGLVQELNRIRNGWIGHRQQWMNTPDRAYQQQTSQLLLAIRAMHRDWAEQQTPATPDPLTGDGPPVFADPQRVRERLVNERALEHTRRLEERYNEQQRAEFQQRYDQQLASFQRIIDGAGRAYAGACRTPAFLCCEQHDYDGADFASGQAYSQTMALCLSGGISEAPVTDSADADSGPTAMLWDTWLRNPQSPVYRALLRRDRQLLAELLPSFKASTDTDWNDSEKLYAALSKILASDESMQLLRPSVQDAMAQLLGALNAASARLQPALGPGVERAVSRLNSAIQLLHNGIHLTELKVQMKLSEYYALQCEHLRELQRKAADTSDRAINNLKDKLGEVDHEARQVRTAVRPIILNGLLSMAVLDPRIAALTVTISIWVNAKASEIAQLQASLMRTANLGAEQLGKGAHAALGSIAVGIGTLDPHARKLLQGLQIPVHQTATWVRTGFSGLRGAAGSGELLLALGGLYLLGDAMKKNLEEVDRVIGEKSMEARLALYGSSLGVLGSGMEVVGIALRRGAQYVQKMNVAPAYGAAAHSPIAQIGKTLSKVGATIGAASGFYDAAQASFAISRTLNRGDTLAAQLYAASAVLSGAGGIIGMAAALSGASVLLGPLGIAIMLSVAGYAFYKTAEKQESTLLELWAKRCFFGVHDEKPPIHWNRPEHGPTAIAELNAATLGIEVGINFQLLTSSGSSPRVGYGTASGGTPSVQQILKYRLRLPHYDASRSAYYWKLTISRRGEKSSSNYRNGETLVEGSLSPLPIAANEPTTAPGFSKNTVPTENINTPSTSITTVPSTNKNTIQIKEISGFIDLSKHTDGHNIETATLTLTYWPDRYTPEAYAQLNLSDRP
ncbi:T6SS effector BTH_I2691 family protein [Pseudomonas sp. NPDC087612]|uniref:T6SS effector BTH_I2691 family protein n=1 Tax=Pseudomonas sp. NPDC087612 TaxID=3364441 RepID=UPI0037FD4BDE